jgi:L-2-hydroxyglutarate oxidase LhgO
MYDLLVIGGGAIGLAVARYFQIEQGWQCLLVEKEGQVGQGISARNSEVLHAGFYYPTGSLKASLCVDGHQRLVNYVRANDLPHNLCGKYIVAEPADYPNLELLLDQGLENGVDTLKLVDSDVLPAVCNKLAPLPALFSPETGVFSAAAYMHRMAADFVAAGGDLATHTSFGTMEQIRDHYLVVLNDEQGEETTIETRRAVNSAGLGALDIADGAGFDYTARGYRLRYCKGSYFKVEGARTAIPTLVYPLPTSNSLGIHIKIDMQDEVHIGPNAQYMAENVEDYRVDPGLEAEYRREAELYWPSLTDSELTADWAGIRPHIYIDGQLHHDFHIIHETEAGCPGWINLLGMDSPGLTASMAVGPYIGELL